jgi:cobalt-zinc-cadmium efflux system protein
VSGHAAAHSHNAASAATSLKVALGLTAGIAIFEFVGGLRAQSLALVSDSAHVSMDVVALAIALAAQIHSLRPATPRQTYGFARLEVLAGLFNGALLCAVTVLIGYEAVRRLMQPEPSQGLLMIVVAAIGLTINVSVGLMLMRGAYADLNTRAAMLHVAGDALGAIAVIIGGAAILLTGWEWVDPALSLLVAAIILAGVWRIVREAAHVLLESTPAHLALPLVRDRIRSLEGVVDVHDLHVWSIGTGSHVLSAHVLLPDKQISEASAILRQIEQTMHDEFEIGHVTVQFECEACEADDRIICTHPQ